MKLIRAAGKKVVRHFIAPPWTSSTMEFNQGLWSGVSALFTESGRQLGEENARPFLFNDHIPAKTIECKYEGSRFGHPINMSALRIAMTNFDPALQITKAVIQYHAAFVLKTNPKQRNGMWDLYVVALASIALIAYSIRKRPRLRSSDIIADDLASQYQFIAGIFMIGRDMIDTNSDITTNNNPIDAAQLYHYADQHEIFKSFNGWVCAGSTKKIMDFLEFCTSELENGFSAQTTDLNDRSPCPLDDIVGDVDQWYRYAILSVEFDCFVKIARRKHRIEDAVTSASEDEVSLNTYRKIARYCTSLMSPKDVPSDDGYKSGALQRQNKILEVLGRKPIAKFSERALAEQLTYD